MIDCLATSYKSQNRYQFACVVENDMRIDFIRFRPTALAAIFINKGFKLLQVLKMGVRTNCSVQDDCAETLAVNKY